MRIRHIRCPSPGVEFTDIYIYDCLSFQQISDTASESSYRKHFYRSLLVKFVAYTNTILHTSIRTEHCYIAVLRFRRTSWYKTYLQPHLPPPFPPHPPIIYHTHIIKPRLRTSRGFFEESTSTYIESNPIRNPLWARELCGEHPGLVEAGGKRGKMRRRKRFSI